MAKLQEWACEVEGMMKKMIKKAGQRIRIIMSIDANTVMTKFENMVGDFILRKVDFDRSMTIANLLHAFKLRCVNTYESDNVYFDDDDSYFKASPLTHFPYNGTAPRQIDFVVAPCNVASQWQVLGNLAGFKGKTSSDHDPLALTVIVDCAGSRKRDWKFRNGWQPRSD